MQYTIEYYNQRVLAEIESWRSDILADYARLAELLMEFGPILKMPHSRSMGGGLFELRARGREGAARALYCFALDRRIVVLHAMVKKTRSVPRRDLDIARARVKEVRHGSR
jgi:phage-related protein